MGAWGGLCDWAASQLHSRNNYYERFDGEIPQSRDIIWMLLRRNWSEPARRPGTVPRRLICPRLVSHLHIAGVFVCAFFGIFCI